MNDRQKTLAAVTILIGLFVLVILIVGIVISGRKVLSPVPDEGAIKIIFVTPTAEPSPTPEGPPTPTPKNAPKATPTPKS